MLDLIVRILANFWDEILKSIADIFFNILDSIPVPSFVADLPNYASQLGGATYWLDVLNIGAGMGMIFSAYVIRFSIRRIPFIG